MPFTKKFRTDFFLENKQLKLSKDYLSRVKFKKITGTRLGSVLGKDKYRSPLKIWLILSNIYEEYMDETFANTGRVVEEKILSYVKAKLNSNYHSHDPVQNNWDLFKTNKYFGGIPDAEADGAPMLEIKTTSIDDFVYEYDRVSRGLVLKKDEFGVPLVKTVGGKYQKWFNGSKIIMPDNYKMQLGLYLYLRGQTDGMFVVCFLRKEDYALPEKCDVKEREIVFEKMHVNLNAFSKYIQSAQDWYERYVLNGVSPEMTDQDMEWFFKEINENEKK